MGQIMRFHCVVPEGPAVELNARVRPGPDPAPLFLPSNEGLITLPHEGWWILRFPYPWLPGCSGRVGCKAVVGG